MVVYAPESPWLEFRRGGITGTDAAAILGRGYGSPYTVWADKQGLLPPKEETEPMYWGNRLEPVVVEEFMRRTGYREIRPDMASAPDFLPGCRLHFLQHPQDGRSNILKLMLQHEAEPWARATPDAFFLRPDGALGILECKTTDIINADAWEDGNAPMAAQIQLQWNLHVSGLKHGALACLIGGRRFVGYEVERNDRFIAHLRQEALKFHVAYVMVPGAKPPLPQGGDLEAVRLLAGTENGQTIVLPPEAAEVDEHLQALEENIRLASDDRDACRAQIIAWMGENSVGEIPGVARYTYHTQQRGDAEYRVLRRRQMP